MCLKVHHTSRSHTLSEPAPGGKSSDKAIGDKGTWECKPRVQAAAKYSLLQCRTEVIANFPVYFRHSTQLVECLVYIERVSGSSPKAVQEMKLYHREVP